MSFTAEEIEEFKTEAFELLEAAEKSLLALDHDVSADYRASFDNVFRSFHNLKGASGMMELTTLQAHTHELENILMPFKEKTSMPKSYISFFLKGIDGARSLLNGEAISFTYEVTEDAVVAAETLPVVAAAKSEAKEFETPASAMDEFYAESEEILDRVDSVLRRLEAGEQTQEMINGLYRDVHSLKGTAYLFGFNEAGNLAHAMESGLELVREGTHRVTRSLMNTLFQCTKCLALDLQNSRRGITDPGPQSQMPKLSMQLLEAMNEVDGLVTAPAAAPAAAETATVPPLKLVVEEPVPAITKIPEGVSVPVVASNVKDHDVSASSIRVPVALLDNLMTLMGEMVLVRNQVLQFANTSENLEFQNLSKRLNMVTSEIQGEMMKTRMQPVGNVLSKFHRVVRDLSKDLKKNIELDLIGQETELDKSLLEAIKDPLTHIVRNSCDHGIETIVQRHQVGKNEQGRITIKAFHEGGQVVIEVSDDGKGLHKNVLTQKAIEKGLLTPAQAALLTDKEVYALIFAPGFSTAQTVTNVSGRGVGMDVVRTNIEKIGGSVELTSSAGRGTTTRLKIPLTLAIVPALIVNCEKGAYAIPQVKLEELVRVDLQGVEDRIEYLQGAPVYRLRGQILPLVNLGEILNVKKEREQSRYCTIAVLNADHCSFGLIVDEVQDTGDIVVKPINRLLKSLQVYSGATILGDGSIALILDVNGIARVANLTSERQRNDELQAKRREKQNSQSLQDFLLVQVNAPTQHSFVLNYVHRLEEFKLNEIELSGAHRVVRYGNSILPLISVSEQLGYGLPADEYDRETIPVIVIQKAGAMYGLVVHDILDTFRTEVDVEASLNKQPGIYGNINLPDRLVVTVDPYEIIDMAFPKAVTRAQGLVAETMDVTSTMISRNVRILVAEDTSFFRRAFMRVLTEAGHDVTVAEDGRDAMDILEREGSTFDMVISDIEMPRMNGFDLARAIRANPRLQSLPLMAVSSRADGRSTEKGIQSGFNIYLEKLKPELLLQGVRQLTATQKRAV